MQKKKRARLKNLESTALSPHPWPGLPLLQPAHLLNQRCFEQLAEAVRTMSAGSGSPAALALQEFAGQVDERVCERAGRCPVLLVDLNFQRPEWWQQVEYTTPAGLNEDLSRTVFTREAAAPLLREILMEAWSTGRTLPRTTALFFGMAPGVTQAITRMSVLEIDRLVANHAQYLRPRWENRGTFWRRLVQATIGIDEEALVNVQLHCLSLLGGEQLARSRANASPS
jgi:hypothetical protein